MSINRNELIRALEQLGYPVPDADGNLQANVTPRTGTLADLLTVTDAGDGEIATATDIEALVLYQGSPSVAKPMLRGVSVIAGAEVDSTVTSFPVGTAFTPIPLVLATVGLASPTGIVSPADDAFIMPSWFSSYSIAGKRALINLKMSLNLLLVSVTAGTQYDIKFQGRRAGSWIDISPVRSNVIPAGAVSIALSESMSILLKPELLNLFDAFRVVLRHDAGTAEGSMTFSNTPAYTPISLEATRIDTDPDA